MALGIYQNFFAAADPRRDALWLPQDSATVDESTVLPLVLQESWNKGLTVFPAASPTSNGVLFALYPNNLELGRNLAASALASPRAAPAPGPSFPRDVHTAFNTRTSSHLGLGLPLPTALVSTCSSRSNRPPWNASATLSGGFKNTTFRRQLTVVLPSA